MAMARVILALISTPVALILIAPLALLALPFWVVARLSRAAARRLEPKHVPWSDVLEYAPVIGWKPKPDLDDYYLDAGNDICRIITDSEGWPSKRSLSESQIVVFGDSFAFGYGVDTERSYSELVSEASVKGIGAPGYSMVQGLLMMRRMSQQLRDKLVVWLVCLDNDLYDNLNPERPNFYTAPFVRNVDGTGRWETVDHHVTISKAHKPFGRSPYYPFLAHMCTPGPMSQRAYSACAYLIGEAKTICDAAGAMLVVVTVPNKNQLSASGVRFLASHLYNAPDLDPTYPDFNFSDVCQKLGVGFLALKDHLSLDHYKVADVHWNESGHRKVAEVLDEIYGEYVSKGAEAANSVGIANRSASLVEGAEGAVHTRRLE
jgi:hypothetical protein